MHSFNFCLSNNTYIYFWMLTFLDTIFSISRCLFDSMSCLSLSPVKPSWHSLRQSWMSWMAYDKLEVSSDEAAIRQNQIPLHVICLIFFPALRMVSFIFQIVIVLWCDDIFESNLTVVFNILDLCIYN